MSLLLFEHRMNWLLVTAYLCWTLPLLTHQKKFALLGHSLTNAPSLQVDRGELIYIAAGHQLYKLNSNLDPQQNINLTSPAVKISLNPEGDELVVCMEDLSCLMYSANDLSVQPLVGNVALANATDISLFSSGRDFYAGSSDYPVGDSVGTIRLSRIFNLSMNTYSGQSKDYTITRHGFHRKFIHGFSVEKYSYFVVLDTGDHPSIRIMRATNDPLCCSIGDETCSFTALSEDMIFCATESNNFIEEDDDICGVSMVTDFGGKKGFSIVLSRCHHSAQSGHNLVCSISIDDINDRLDGTYDLCSTGAQPQTGTAWGDLTSCYTRSVSSKNHSTFH